MGQRKVAKAGGYVDQAIRVDEAKTKDVQDIAPDEKMDWNYAHLSLDAPRAGPLRASSSVPSADVDAASEAVLGFATVAVEKMLNKEERKDMSTSSQAGSLPSTLDHRVMPSPGSPEEPAEEVAKSQLWQLMLDAMAVSRASQKEAARWVRAFATKIAGHAHHTPALSLHAPGNVTEVHQHLMPVLHYLLRGTKWWFLWPPHSFGTTLSKVTHKRQAASGSCLLATREVADLVRLAKKQGFRVRQEAGTVMYLPAGWYHFVVTVGVAPVKPAPRLAETYCVSLVGWLGVANLRAGCYLLALDPRVFEDQTPPDDAESMSEGAFYPPRAWAPEDKAGNARLQKEGVPEEEWPKRQRVSKEVARARHNERVMSMYTELFAIGGR